VSTGRGTTARKLQPPEVPGEAHTAAPTPVQVAPAPPERAAATFAPPPAAPTVEVAPPEPELPPTPAAPPAPPDKGLVWLMSPEESIKLIRESQAQLRATQPAASVRAQPPSPPVPPQAMPPRTVAASAPPLAAGASVSMRVTSPGMRAVGADGYVERMPERRRPAAVVTHAPGSNGRRQVTISLPTARQVAIGAAIVGVAMLGYAAGQRGGGTRSGAESVQAAETANEPAPAAIPPRTPAREAPRPEPRAQLPEQSASPAATPVVRTPPPRSQTTAAAAPAAAQPTAVVAAPTTAPAPAPTTGSVRGTVRDPGGRGIAGARVTVRGSALAATSDGSGAYEIRDVPEGAVVLQAAAEGFVSATADVRTRAGAAVSADLALAAPPPPAAPAPAPVAAAEPDRELAAGGWAGVSRSEAATLLGGAFGAIQGMAIESVARSTAGSRPRVRVTQITPAGERIVLTETRAGAAVRAGPATITALRVMPPSEAYPYSTGTVSFGGILITAKASIPAEALRAHLQRLGEIQ